MAGITKAELSARRQRLRDELPNHAWDYRKAGIAAGYSRSYARARLRKYATKDNTFCQQVAAKRAEIEAQSQDKREKAERKLLTIIDDPDAKKQDAIRAIEVLGRMSGWMSETRVLEVAERQRELTEAQREEARRLALLRFDTRLMGSVQPADVPAERPSGEPSAEQRRLTGS